VKGDELFFDLELFPHPGEELGIARTIVNIDQSEFSYEFNIFWIFEDVRSGRIFYGHDEGCSCPLPFENEIFDGPDNTTFAELTKDRYDTFEREFQYWARDAKLPFDEYMNSMDKVKEVINARDVS